MRKKSSIISSKCCITPVFRRKIGKKAQKKRAKKPITKNFLTHMKEEDYGSYQ